MKKHLNFKDRVGEKWLTNEGYTIEIIECFGCYDCTIRFNSGVIIKNRKYSDIKKGKVKNPYHKSVFGVGYFGVGRYSPKSHLKAYDTWSNMLKRCYNVKFQEKNLTYKGCLVDEKWHSFQNFAEWYEENYVEYFALDKDVLLKGNKSYSPRACAFIPTEINNLFLKRNSKRGKYPIGVGKNGKKYVAECKIGKDKRIYLGLFNTPEEAFQAYKEAKEKYIKEIADKWKDKITEKVYRALINYKVEITD